VIYRASNQRALALAFGIVRCRKVFLQEERFNESDIEASHAAPLGLQQEDYNAVYRYLHSVVDLCHLHTSMPYDRLKWEGTTFAWRKDWGERKHLPGHCQKFGNCYPEDKKDDHVLAREKVGTLQRPNGSRGPRGIFSNLF
jgi:hypothetical protein